MIRKSGFNVEQNRQEIRALPLAEAIEDLGRLAMLLWKLTPRHKQLLWARACRVQWAELCRRQQLSRTTMTRDHRLALMALAMAGREADSSRHLAKIGHFLLYAAAHSSMPPISPTGRR